MERKVLLFAHDFAAIGSRRALRRLRPGLPQATPQLFLFFLCTLGDVNVVILRRALNGMLFSLQMFVLEWLYWWASAC